MADVKWIGAAVAVAQLDTMTVGGTIEADDLFNMTLTSNDGTTQTLSVVAGSTVIATVVATIVSAWNTSTLSLFATITAADASPDITLTADEAGDAFTLAVETTEAGGGAADAQTFVRAATTANGGPKDWRDVNNWDLGALPGSAASHDVFIENFAGDIVYGLDQSGVGNTLTSLTIGATYTGKLGENGAAGLAGDYLVIDVTTLNIGRHFGAGNPAGSQRIKVNTGAVASTINIYKSSTSFDPGKPAIRLLANNAATDINVYRGTVAIANESGETSSVNDVNVLWTTNRATDSEVYIKSGVTFGGTLTKTGGICVCQVAVATVVHSSGTLSMQGSGATTTFTVTGGTVTTVSSGNITTVNMTAGVFTADSAGTVGTLTITGGTATLKDTGNITTINATSGTVTVSGSALIGTLTAKGSVVFSNSSGEITTLTITGGTVDFNGSLTARTVTTLNLDKSGRLKYDPAIVTMTNKVGSNDAVTLTAT